MAVGLRKDVSVWDRLSGQPVQENRVCKYWLQGRCNRNPCRFMHRESPPPHKDIHQKQPRNATWKNPKYNSTNGGSVRKAVLEDSKRKSGHMDQEKTIASTAAKAESKSVQKAQPTQCKYWVTGNCVHGDKCKDLHSWFSGSGFTMLTKLEGHTKAITGISLPSGCDKLYSGGKDRTIRAWDCNSGQCAGTMTADGEVGSMIAEGPWVFVGLQNSVKAWNLQNNAEFSLTGPTGLVCSLAVDGDKLFAGIEDGTILVWKWNPETNIPEQTAMLKEHDGAVCSLVVGANRLYSASRDSTIKVWDMQNLQCLQTLYGHTSDVMSVLCWDSYLISASLDKTLKIWCATESGTIEVVYEIKDDHEMIALCGLHDAQAQPILLCSCSDNTVRLYDLPSFVERGRIFSKREVQVIQIGIDGLFFTGDATGEISVWKLLGAPNAALS